MLVKAMALIVGAFPSAAPAQSAPANDSVVVREVRERTRAMEQAFARGDLSAVAGFFDDQAVIRSSRAVGAAGRAAIDGYFANVPAPKAMTVETYDVLVQGDVAHHTGLMTVVFGEPARSNRYQVALTWRRGRDGRMRIASQYYHVPEPADTAQRAPALLSAERTALWREIRAVNDSMEAAFGRGDMKAVAAFYTDDAQMTGGSAMVSGRQAIDAYWARLGGNGGRWELDVLEVGGSRALAYQRGRSRIITRDANGRERVAAVDFVVIWRREANGALRMLMDLY